MSPSLRALLSGIIDYAGLFPPAKLPMHEAVRNYARYRQSPESWMLGRFICPAARLEELGPFLDELLERGPPVSLSILGRGSDNPDEFMKGFAADREALATFQAQHCGQALIDSLELRIPALVMQNQVVPSVFELFSNVADLLDELQLGVRVPFYEVDVRPDWLESSASVLAALSVSGDQFIAPRRLKTGYKLRCGGLEASAFPSVEQVAYTIATCRDYRLPLKFTAGLHHPIRHFDASVCTPMHGFLNVFGAGVLAYARILSLGQIREIIEDETPANFVFGRKDFGWKEFSATTAEITEARQQFVTSFGSCSFEEPIADLRAMGLLP